MCCPQQSHNAVLCSLKLLMCGSDDISEISVYILSYCVVNKAMISDTAGIIVFI